MVLIAQVVEQLVWKTRVAEAKWTQYQVLCETYVAYTRCSCQVTAATLYILQYQVYNNCNTDREDEPLGFNEWHSKGEESGCKFQ